MLETNILLLTLLILVGGLAPLSWAGVAYWKWQWSHTPIAYLFKAMIYWGLTLLTLEIYRYVLNYVEF